MKKLSGLITLLIVISLITTCGLFKEDPPEQIVVFPETVILAPGETQQFTSIIDIDSDNYYYYGPQITWEIEGNAGTSTISKGGLFTMGANETAESITIIAKTSSSSYIDGTASVTIGTKIYFDNSQGMCSAIIYDDARRRDEDIIMEIPARSKSIGMIWEPGDSTPFYYTYGISIRNYFDFFIYYTSPNLSSSQTTPRIDRNKNNAIHIPDISEAVTATTLLSDKSYILLKNNSSYPIIFMNGSTPVTPDHTIESTIIMRNETAQYKIEPGDATVYKVRNNADEDPFPRIDEFEAGNIYVYEYNGVKSLTYKDTVELKLANVAFSGSGSSSGNVLQSGTWVNGIFPASTGTITYTINVQSGTTYRIWWNDYYDGNGTKTADVYVSARFSDSDTNIFSNIDSGWTSPCSFTATKTGTVWVTVQKNWNYSYGDTFGIVYSTSSTRPLL